MVNLRSSDGRSLYFTNRKEYYRRIKISEALQIYRATGVTKAKRNKKIYFVNFTIDDSNGYVQGSLSSPKKIPFEEAKNIIIINCPPDYTPIEFYEAEEEGNQKETIFTIIRTDPDEEIISEVLNV